MPTENDPFIFIDISSIKNDFDDASSKQTFTEEQFENGWQIHQKSISHFRNFSQKNQKEKKVAGIYGLFWKETVHDRNVMLYFGSYHLTKKMKITRLLYHVRYIFKVFGSGETSSIKSTNHGSFYSKLFKLMIETDEMIDFVTISNLIHPKSSKER